MPTPTKDTTMTRCANCTPRTLTTKFALCRACAADEERSPVNEGPVAQSPRDRECGNNNWNWVRQVFSAVGYNSKC
jgi:ribosomal protein S14